MGSHSLSFCHGSWHTWWSYLRLPYLTLAHFSYLGQVSWLILWTPTSTVSQCTLVVCPCVFFHYFSLIDFLVNVSLVCIQWILEVEEANRNATMYCDGNTDLILSSMNAQSYMYRALRELVVTVKDIYEMNIAWGGIHAHVLVHLRYYYIHRSLLWKVILSSKP